MAQKDGLADQRHLLWTFHEGIGTKCRYTPMDAQSTTIMSVVLAIVLGYFAGRAIGV